MSADRRHPLIPPRVVDPRQELPALELRVLERWRERDVFAQSLRRREGAEQWVFYEGPPTANGPPGSHHVLSRVFKDIYPRFQTMRGYRVERKGGWDCHGLPVEIAVEEELGIEHKSEIEEYGIARFNARCRESVFRFLEEWNRLTERIGFWIDLEHAYRTLDESYIESVWWALSQIHARGLLYEGRKVVPYCPRCETTLSSHEVALGYRDVVDESVFLKLPVSDREERLLVWTTTPWTLPGNVAVAVSPGATYVTARVNDDYLVIAEPRMAAVLGEGAEVVERCSGVELVERFGSYEGPIFAATDRERGPLPIVADEFVTTQDGTGIVHLAPAFGEDDYRVAGASPRVAFDPTRADTLYNPVRADGTYDARTRGRDGRSYEGRFVKDPRLTRELIEDLRERGLLLRVQEYEHSYPHCWRCGTPLLYYAKPSWYIATSSLRDELLAANETVDWQPEHVKHGRFGDWLKNNVDWALSRERYWGTPLPVWRCPRGHVHVVDSFEELAERSGRTLEDHHRPYVDEVAFACPHPRGEAAGAASEHDVFARPHPRGEAAGAASEHDAGAGVSATDGAGGECGEPMRRVPEVIDVWFDSGAMPFAQHHFPFENETVFRERYPADFICEAQDQTRGWFYSLLAIATLLDRQAPYRNVVCLGLILDEEGQKMSKSKGNTVEPWQVLDSYGADAFRWYFFTAKQPWDGYRFSTETIGEGVRLFLKQLWSTYYFYVLYAHACADELRGSDGADDVSDTAAAATTAANGHAGDPAPAATEAGDCAGVRDRAVDTAGAEDLDRWALSRTASTAELVAERLDAYDATSAGRAIAELVDELSNWYVRRSRRRFWDGERAAFATLRTCLLTVAKLLAPLCPFIADEIYDNLDGTLASVHLCDFPAAADVAPRDEELERAMALARETVRLGLGARGQAKIKVRQPLGEAVVVADGRERRAIERLADVVREELNVRSVRFVAAADELGTYEVKANYRRLGPLFGKDMPLAAAAIAALDPARVAAAVRAGADGDGAGGVGIAVADREHTLTADDVLLTLRAPEGYSVEREGAHAVALDLTIDEDLRREGRAREIVHAVQNARKSAGLQVEDRIELTLDGDPALLEAAAEHRDYIAAETLALSFQIAEPRARASIEYSEQTEIDGLALAIALRRAPRP
ncbi:MAG TPA: class I tRNA ligase family protein [Solirubrobacteraceae bacterium]|nr:class I tRNA ligase family protein [Solirubrobacteraceae bacterium]